MLPTVKPLQASMPSFGANGPSPRKTSQASSGYQSARQEPLFGAKPSASLLKRLPAAFMLVGALMGVGAGVSALNGGEPPLPVSASDIAGLQKGAAQNPQEIQQKTNAMLADLPDAPTADQVLMSMSDHGIPIGAGHSETRDHAEKRAELASLLIRKMNGREVSQDDLKRAKDAYIAFLPPSEQKKQNAYLNALIRESDSNTPETISLLLGAVLFLQGVRLRGEIANPRGKRNANGEQAIRWIPFTRKYDAEGQGMAYDADLPGRVGPRDPLTSKDFLA